MQFGWHKKKKNSQFDEDLCKQKQTGGGEDREREGCGMIAGAVSEGEANRVSVKEEAWKRSMWEWCSIRDDKERGKREWERKRERERDCNETEITAVSHQRLSAALNSESEDNPSGWDYVCMRERDAFIMQMPFSFCSVSHVVCCGNLKKGVMEQLIIDLTSFKSWKDVID